MGGTSANRTLPGDNQSLTDSDRVGKQNRAGRAIRLNSPGIDWRFSERTRPGRGVRPVNAGR